MREHCYFYAPVSSPFSLYFPVSTLIFWNLFSIVLGYLFLQEGRMHTSLITENGYHSFALSSFLMRRLSKRTAPRTDQLKIRSISFCCRCSLSRAGSTCMSSWDVTTYNFMSVLSFLDIKLLCSCQNHTWNKPSAGYISMYPWSDIEENVAVHKLFTLDKKKVVRQRKFRESTRESRTERK